MRTRVKICGVRDPDTALAAADAGADAIGLVFVRSSPRYVDPAAAYEIMANLPPFVATVGVFMNHSVEAFSDIEEACPTTHVQLHGNETEAVVRQCGPGVIRSIRFDPESIRDDLARWEAIDEVDALLIDGPIAGSGEAFDWAALAPLIEELTKPVILAGGLSPANVREAIRAVRPFGVDVSSGVERDRGIKDPDLIEAFCEAVREADRA